MLRSLCLGALVAPLFVACQSLAKAGPLALWDTFPIAYEGRYRPVGFDELAFVREHVVLSREAEPLPITGELAVIAPQVVATSIQATIVELPVAEVRQLLPAWPRVGPRVQGAHIAQHDLAQRLEEWQQRGVVVADPTLVVGEGEGAWFHSCKARSYVARLDIKAGADPLLTDPVIGKFACGIELSLLPQRVGDRTVIDVEWRQRDLACSQTMVGIDDGRAGTIEVPVVLDQRVAGQVEVVSGAMLLLGSMIGTHPDTVCLLCIELGDTTAPLPKGDEQGEPKLTPIQKFYVDHSFELGAGR